jgi:hypothetical protein
MMSFKSANYFDLISPNSIQYDHIGIEGLSVGPDGSVYAADNYNHRVQVFWSDGTFVRMWGSQGNGGNGQFPGF